VKESELESELELESDLELDSSWKTTPEIEDLHHSRSSKALRCNCCSRKFGQTAAFDDRPNSFVRRYPTKAGH